MNQIPPQYNPRDVEDRIYAFWNKKNIFFAKADSAKKPFSIVIPPPNITGILHMGHALNNTIQDILIRYHRMLGESSLWMPGTDHAGIATQNVVEKSIAKEGLKRQDLGREKFLERVWQWREEYGSTIINQLKKLGASCDWPRTRFTMDEEYSRAVKEVFVKLWEREPTGLIYQADKVINWCPRCQTALSDEEAPHQDVEGKLYYIRYPLKRKIPNHKSQITNKSQIPNDKLKDYIVVATTRPETMLGDTAVAVNPKDKRFKKLIGESVILPLMNREIKIISDDFVDPKFGTGLVKVTPAHDPNDYQMGLRHKLEFVNILNPDATLNKNAGKYCGLDRFKARERVLEDLKQNNLIEKIEEHAHAVGHCYRCHTVIEPYLSRQWFVKMKPLAKPAIDVVKKGKIKFYPSRWTKVYLNWMENIQDWCISRQIWWGHRIPLWYCNNCKKLALASVDEPKECPICKSTNIKQDEDVLDTWFSSWLWPFATLYWPKESEEIKYFYPTSVLVTAPEIIFFWVARMIMAGLEFMGEIPFKDVYIHGTVRDIEGKKMSKSLGNIIDPLDIIKEYGCDALRFSLISLTSTGQDVFLSEEKFEKGRNFANKIWNASRFILSNLKQENIKADLCVFFKEEDLGLAERWILSNFYEMLTKLNNALALYRFNEAVNLVYDFFWAKFCDWYIEIAKLNIEDKRTQLVLYKILEKSLRILHPFMPFITEEIWQKLPNQDKSISISSWPHVQKQIVDKAVNAQMGYLIDTIVAARNVRSMVNVPPTEPLTLQVQTSDKKIVQVISQHEAIVKRLAMLKDITFIQEKGERKKGMSAVVSKELSINVPLEGVIDLEKEKKRVADQISQHTQLLKQKEAQLKNKEFSKKAPTDIVERERGKTQELKGKLAQLKEILRLIC